MIHLIAIKGSHSSLRARSQGFKITIENPLGCCHFGEESGSAHYFFSKVPAGVVCSQMQPTSLCLQHEQHLGTETIWLGSEISWFLISLDFSGFSSRVALKYQLLRKSSCRVISRWTVFPQHVKEEKGSICRKQTVGILKRSLNTSNDQSLATQRLDFFPRKQWQNQHLSHFLHNHNKPYKVSRKGYS
jgi:hypothetical protein